MSTAPSTPSPSTTSLTATDPLHALSSIPLFHGLSAGEKEQLRRLLQPRQVPSRTPLLTQHARGEGVFFVLSGSVKIYREQRDGTQIMLNVIGPGEVLGEISALDGHGHTAHAVTLEKTALLWMANSDFDRCVQTMPALGRNLLHLLTRRLRYASARIESLSTHNVHCRVAGLLLGLAQRYADNETYLSTLTPSTLSPSPFLPPHSAVPGSGVSNSSPSSPAPHPPIAIPFRLTQSDIAAMVGASRLRVNKSLGTLVAIGAIHIATTHRIVILEQSLLQRVCE